ncbi:MAG: DNA internalization-related competence protein ComEC/Rec2 [Xanthomonadaceae bacterium]|nr:DNA internalization-related competence protein ComEC/Rec2 [Xanthomonadaceae bacterium]
MNGLRNAGRFWQGRPARSPAPLGVATAIGALSGASLILFGCADLPAGLLLQSMLLLGLVLWGRGGRSRWLGPVLAGFGWAGLHAGWALALRLPAEWEGRDVEVSGQVVGLPEAEAGRTRFLFRVDPDGEQPEVLRGRLLRLSWHDPSGHEGGGNAGRAELRSGGRWRFGIRLRAPRGLSNPGGFDSERNMVAHRLGATGHVLRPETAQQLHTRNSIDGWRERMAQRIEMRAPASSERFIRALALGDTRGLTGTDWEQLRATGLTHLIAISGFHVGVVASFFAALAGAMWRLCPVLARNWPRPQAMAVVSLLAALGYAAVAGFALPTVRTVLMIGVAMAARLWRRPLGVVHSLALALIAVLAFDPLSLLMAGFWLSFAGVAWLVWCLPRTPAQAWFGFLSAQGVATLGLLPLTMALFGQASLAGPVANLLAIPWWSLVVVPLALLGTALEALHSGWGTGIWRLAAGCFDPSWRLFQWLGSTRVAMQWLSEAPVQALPLALLGAFCLLMPRASPGKPLALLLWLPMLCPPRELPAPGELELVVIDVGQGLSVLVRTAGHSLLYDAGPAVPEGFDAGDRVVLPALRALGVTHLDRIVISHADMDHAGGLDAVRRGIWPDATFAPEGADIERTLPCRAGMAWEWDGVSFRLLHPPVHFPYLGNESSCVLRVEGRYGAVLLPGDLGQVIERRLAREVPEQVRADVVVAGHHGSKGSSAPLFVNATGARLAVMSAGHGNRFGHPDAGVVRRWRRAGAEVINTADSGAIRIWLDADGMALRERRVSRARWWDAARFSDPGKVPAAILSDHE